MSDDKPVEVEIAERLSRLERLLSNIDELRQMDNLSEGVPEKIVLGDVRYYQTDHEDTFAVDHTERLQTESGERVCEWEKIEVMFQSDSDGYDTDCKPEMIPVKKPNWGEHCPGCGGRIEILDSEEQENE